MLSSFLFPRGKIAAFPLLHFNFVFCGRGGAGEGQEDEG